MTKKGILLSAVLLLAITVSSPADEKKVDVEVDLTYVSNYLWNGFPIFGGQPAFQPSFNFDLFDSGFSINLFGAFGDAAKTTIYEELNYTLAYENSIFSDAKYKTDYKLHFTFYDFKMWHIDKHEIGLQLTWPDVCSRGFVPGYYVACMWPRDHYEGVNDLQGDASGFFHVFSLAYNLSAPGIMPDRPEQIVTLTADVTYNDGAGARYLGPTADHDWSHATFGASTDINIGEFILRPAISCQLSMDDSVNPNDVVVGSLSLICRF
jgi:hypothetical protein